MAKTKAKWIFFDTNSLMDENGNLTVFLLDGGGLERTATGVRIKTGGVTDAMLAGDIAFSKLADNADIARLSEDEQITGTWNFPSGVSTPTINADAIATQAYVDNALAGLDFQPDVLNKQVDATLDPGASPATGDRYIITDSTNLNANFGTIVNLGDNDIVEYDGTSFVVDYDVSVEGAGALTWNTAAGYFERYDGTSWDEFGGLSGVTAGGGLDKSGNTIFVGAGDGITVNADDVAVKPDATGGTNLAKAIDVNANGVAVKVDDVTVGENASGQLEVKDDSIGASKIDETDTYDFSGGSVDVATQTTGDNSTKAASTAFVQDAITNFSTERIKVELFKLTSTDIANGYVTLSSTPVSASIVRMGVHNGVQQLNKQIVGSTGETPDFDVLNNNEVHIANVVASGLSGDLEADDVIQVEYQY